MATCTQYSLDFCLAWALIREWTSRILFPVPAGPWPRHGHAGALLPEYRARSPRLVAWARAAFEQGALPSLLLLQGLVPIFTLPGHKMFQSTGVCRGRQRPPIMHAYGGAKVGMAQALRSIANEGWIALAVAMVGTKGKKPMWADMGLRPVIVPLWTSRFRPSLWRTEKWICCSPAGNGGTINQFRNVHSTLGLPGLTVILAQTVKTLLIFGDRTLIASKRFNCLKRVGSGFYLRQTCTTNHRWRLSCR